MEEITEVQADAVPAAVLAPANPQSAEPGVERFAVAVEFAPASANDGDRTIDAVWYTGAKVPRFDWRTGEEYDLVLSMQGCRLDRLNNGGPVLDSHMAYGVESQMGVVRRAWVAGTTGKATIQFSQRDAVTPIWNDVRAGVVQNLSPGMWIHKKVDTTPKGQERKEFTATDWEPFEISLVPVPADANTTFMSAAGTVPPAPASAVAARASAQKEKPVEPITQATGDEARQNEAVLAAARDEAVKVERLRAATIRTMATPFKMQETFVTGLIDDGLSVEAARERIMAKLAAQWTDNPTSGVNSQVTLGEDAHDKRRKGMEAGILFRGNPGDATLRDAGSHYAGLTLIDLARECLDAAGVKTRGMSRNDIARVALQGRFGAAEYFDGGSMTTSDFPNILANVANKTLRQAYEAAPRTFVPFCRQVSAVDFKPINRVQLSDVPTLPKVNEKGEFHRTALSDSKETYSLATFGEIVAITRKVIINDDLQALNRVPAGLGQAAAQLESDTVWAVITGNPNMSDGNAVFSAAHKNLNTTNALALAALSTARAAFRVQKAPKGTILNLQPRYLIVPAALEQAADQLIYPINLAATAVTGVVPPWIQSLTKIVEGRLDAVATVGVTNWFMAVDPSQIDTLEYCYLEGQQGVYIETRQGFEVDGVEIKARLDFAAGAIDFRGLCKNTA